MSEFQYYEFMTIDRPLSKQEKEEVSSWSSRTEPSNHRAVFTYHYGDFPKNERTVVEQYFDAMLYTANWGSTRLILKFPASLVNVRQLGQYSVEGLDVLEKSGTVLVDINLTEEDGYDRWIEEETQLASLISLRSDIMAGDYRCLYLIWLKVSTEEAMSEWGDVDLDSEEPLVPAGLQVLDGALSDFVEAFGIDPDMIAAAAAGSDSLSKSKTDYPALIETLSDDVKNDFLRRVLENEPLLSIKLEQELALSVDIDRPINRNNQKHRTVGELVQLITTAQNRREENEKKAKEEQRIAELKNTERREDYLWQRVDSLIEEKNARSYDDAIRILQELKGLAEYKGQYQAFNHRVKAIREKNSRRSSLKHKIDLANVIDAS